MRIYWNEPMYQEGVPSNPHLPIVSSADAEDIIKWWKLVHPTATYTDEEALDEFMVVYHAWRDYR